MFCTKQIHGLMSTLSIQYLLKIKPFSIASLYETTSWKYSPMKVSTFSASVPFARQSKIKKLVEGCILIRLIDIDTDVYVHYTTICYL